MAADKTLEDVAVEVRVCEKCPLHLTRKNAVPGEGPAEARVVIIGEAPGANEDEQGRPFVGSAGKNLDRFLDKAGLSRAEVFITNTVKCRPPSNRKPKREELDSCHPYLRRQLEVLKPKVVVLLGDIALKEFFPGSNLATMHGKPAKRGELLFIPTYHPAAVLYNRSLSRTIEDDFAEVGRVARGLSA